MRTAFVETLIELAERDPRVMLLTADLGFMALEPFAARFPDRFLNVGVAEQNMVGMATGLAEAGFIPFVYSIATFATLRAYEFVRNGPILHRLPVRVIGVGGGFEYGTAGSTHHGLEDIGVMRMQPGMRVISPADSAQTRAAVLATWDLPGPTYYRVGKNTRPSLPGLDGRFELGRAQIIGRGDDVLLIALGAIASEAVMAATALKASGTNCTVAVIASVSPAPVDDLAILLASFPVALTVEAHSVVGGLGSLVSEIVAEYGIACRIVRCGVRVAPDGVSGGPAYLERRHGIDHESLARTVLAQTRKPASHQS